MEKITSRENENIKRTRRIKDERKLRDELGVFVAEGVRLCEEAAKSGRVIEAYYTEKAYEKENYRMDKIISSAEKVWEISEGVMEKISDTKSPQGIVCICKKLDNENNTDKINSDGRYIVMAGIADPGNAGTIVRTADAMGVDAVIMTRECADIYSPKAVRATMGSIFHIPIVIAEDEKSLFELLRAKGLKSYAAALDEESMALSEVEFGGGSAVLIGNEANGLSDFAVKSSDFKVMIEMKGEAESLNAASAAAILAYKLTHK